MITTGVFGATNAPNAPDAKGKTQETMQKMDLNEIINEALKLTKKDKTQLVNAVLESMSNKKTGFKFPVFRALEEFKARHMEYKSTGYTGTKADFRWMQQLLEHILDKTVEGQSKDTVVVTEDILVSNLNAFLKAVKQLDNKWYFANRFTPEGLAKDFEKIYANIKQNNSYERAKRACDYL